MGWQQHRSALQQQKPTKSQALWLRDKMVSDGINSLCRAAWSDAQLNKEWAKEPLTNHDSGRHSSRHLRKLLNLKAQGFPFSIPLMNELNDWLDQMKGIPTTQTPENGKDGGQKPEGKMREVKYSKPGTEQSLFNPANQPEQSEAQAKQPADQPGEQPGEQPTSESTPESTPQPADQPSNMPPEKSGVELALEAALKAVAEEAKQRKSQQQAQQERDQQQQKQQQEQPPQQDPQALDELTKRVEVLEVNDAQQDDLIVRTVKALEAVDNRVVDIEANYVGQQTFQDSIDAFEKKLTEVSKPTIVQIAERPEVIFKKRVHCAFAEVLFLAQTFGQAYLVGPAGSGKTSTCEDVATAMSLDFGFISCSAGMAEAHLLGRMIANGTYLSSRFVQLYENGGLFLFDEVDAADANTMLVLNSALANGYLSVPNRQENPVAKRHPDFVCLVAANTLGTGSFEYHGRNHLDAAFLDRFALSRHQVEYDLELEREMLAGDAEMARVLHKIRFNLEQTKTRRVLSTRAFISSAKLMLAGKTPQYVIDKLTLGWSEEEKTRAKKDVVVPKTSPLKQIGAKQLEAAKTKREQEAAEAKKQAQAQKEADSIQARHLATLAKSQAPAVLAPLEMLELVEA